MLLLGVQTTICRGFANLGAENQILEQKWRQGDPKWSPKASKGSTMEPKGHQETRHDLTCLVARRIRVFWHSVVAAQPHMKKRPTQAVKTTAVSVAAGSVAVRRRPAQAADSNVVSDAVSSANLTKHVIVEGLTKQNQFFMFSSVDIFAYFDGIVKIDNLDGELKKHVKLSTRLQIQSCYVKTNTKTIKISQKLFPKSMQNQ